jgi:hypothetical protein
MAKPTIRRLTRPFDHDNDDLIKLLKEIADYPPRAGAIMAVAMLDDTLRWSIEGFLANDLTDDDRSAVFEQEHAPMASFHCKILMGHALGIYGSITKGDLVAMKRIRNAFAHAPRSIDFETAEIVSECRRLRYLNAARANAARKILPLKSPISDEPRKLFFTTVTILNLDLHVIASKDARRLGGMP